MRTLIKYQTCEQNSKRCIVNSIPLKLLYKVRCITHVCIVEKFCISICSSTKVEFLSAKRLINLQKFAALQYLFSFILDRIFPIILANLISKILIFTYKLKQFLIECLFRKINSQILLLITSSWFHFCSKWTVRALINLQPKIKILEFKFIRRPISPLALVKAPPFLELCSIL